MVDIRKLKKKKIIKEFILFPISKEKIQISSKFPKQKLLPMFLTKSEPEFVQE